jgi:hypothetical protein
VGFVPEEDASFRQMIAEFTQKANDATIRTALHHGI